MAHKPVSVCIHEFFFFSGFLNSWSKNSRYLLTSSRDWNIIIWDIASESDPPERFATIRFDAPVLSASFHPRNMYAAILSACHVFHLHIAIGK